MFFEQAREQAEREFKANNKDALVRLRSCRCRRHLNTVAALQGFSTGTGAACRKQRTLGTYWLYPRQCILAWRVAAAQPA